MVCDDVVEKFTTFADVNDDVEPLFVWEEVVDFYDSWVVKIFQISNLVEKSFMVFVIHCRLFVNFDSSLNFSVSIDAESDTAIIKLTNLFPKSVVLLNFSIIRSNIKSFPKIF